MIEIGPVVLEKKIFKICHVFSQFRNYLSLEKGGAPHLNKLKSPTAKHDLWFGWNWPSDSGEEDFLNLSMYFRNFIIFSPWKRAGPIIWTNLNPLQPRMIYGLVGIGPVVLEKIF